MQSIYDTLFSQAVKLVEFNLVPDPPIRAGIRYLLSSRATESSPASAEDYYDRLSSFVKHLSSMPVAIKTQDANEQHYEVPTQYFLTVLGKNLKYSSCLYTPAIDKLNQKSSTAAAALDAAEEAMLALCTERADLQDGQHILELGCGWGSWCLYNAAKFPRSRITAVSNSQTQKQHIDAAAKKQGLKNLTVITADMNDFKPPEGQLYDRVVSVEMFEHMKNYKTLLHRVASWLNTGGKLFVHIFVHNKGLPYHYEVNGEDDWMTKYFFSGGTMPSMDLLLHFQQDLALERQWYVNGKHYSKTLEAWLKKHDAAKTEVMAMFDTCYGGSAEALKWFVRWRLFYLACSELFNYENGERWGVGHYVFVKQ